ncbi:hypothetical protein GCM10027347_59500 [Larkinella harenae]
MEKKKFGFWKMILIAIPVGIVGGGIIGRLVGRAEGEKEGQALFMKSMPHLLKMKLDSMGIDTTRMDDDSIRAAYVKNNGEVLFDGQELPGKKKNVQSASADTFKVRLPTP